MLIYKILRADEWRKLQDTGTLDGAPVDLQDGFIHFSTAAQLPETARRHFAGQHGLRLVACAADTLASDLRWEPSRGGDLFPHLYRALRLSDVAWSRDMPLESGGHQIGPLE